jgi:hypothetical protein
MDIFQSYSKKELLSSSCNNENSNTNPDYVNKYKRIENYIPGVSTPIKHIKISINVFTGPGTIQNTTQIIANINQMVDWTNSFYNYVVAASYPITGVIPLTDTKIRFDLDDRIFFMMEQICITILVLELYKRMLQVLMQLALKTLIFI